MPVRRSPLGLLPPVRAGGWPGVAVGARRGRGRVDTRSGSREELPSPAAALAEPG